MRMTCGCGRNLTLRDDLIGKRIKCPACGEILLVRPSRPPAAAAPRVAPADESTPRRKPAPTPTPAPSRRASPAPAAPSGRQQAPPSAKRHREEESEQDDRP